MDADHLKRVLRDYEVQFVENCAITPEQLSDQVYEVVSPKLRPSRVLGHLAWMAQTAIRFVDEGREGKAFRWLGFIQGVLWAKGLSSLDELKNDSRPTPEEEARKG